MDIKQCYGGIHLCEHESLKLIIQQLKRIKINKFIELDFVDWSEFQGEFPETYLQLTEDEYPYYLTEIDKWGRLTLGNGFDIITFHPSTFLYHPFTLNREY